MEKMGFAQQWISLIMRCLSSNSFSFLLNGEVVGNVWPTRGLRQGDPLSPYLFLICSEGLSRLLHKEEQIGNLWGVKITRSAPPISHLLFADDSLLFCHANNSSALAIQRALHIYHQASGQFLNTQKSIMSFSPNTPDDDRTFFSNTLGMSICDCHESYLGLPAYSNRNKKELFSMVKERIWNLLHAWNDKLFSTGGNEVLLKAVVQAIPTYVMSCFRLPIGFCNQLESMMANFWWGSNKDGTKIHWKRWKLLCKSKGEGGMGFRSFVHFNQAMLAKQAWRLFENPNSLLGRLLKHRYFPRTSFFDAHPGHSPSLTWQGILWGRELLLKGLRYKIGNGRHVRSGMDPWIPGHNEFKPISYRGEPSASVSNYILDTMEWDLDLLHENFSQLDVERISTIPLSYYCSQDRLIWHYDTSGIYSVKSGFHLASTLADASHESTSTDFKSWWRYFWSLRLPQKVKIFAWKILHNALPVASALHKRQVITSALCSRCKTTWESIGHALFTCRYAKEVWKRSTFLIDFKKANHMHQGDYLIYLATLMDKNKFELLVCILWSI